MEANDKSSRLRVPAFQDWLPALLLAGVAVWVYVGALPTPFVYDDLNTVVKNPSIQDLGDLGAVLRYDMFRPVANLTFAVDHALWGPEPFGFHLTNVVLHALNVAMVFMLLSCLVQDCLLPGHLVGRIET